MKTDFLKELGLEQGTINKIMAENGKDINDLKNQVASLTTEKTNLESQMAEANKTIENFKSINVDEIKSKATEWETKYNEYVTNSQKELQKVKFDYALENALKTAKVKNNKTIMPLLDTSKIILNDDGTMMGLKEQLEAIKAENDYLFDDGKNLPRVVGHADGKAKDDNEHDDSWFNKILGLPDKK